MSTDGIPRIQIAGAVSIEELILLDRLASGAGISVSVGLLYGESKHMNEPGLDAREIYRVVKSGLLQNIEVVLITYFNAASQIINAAKETGAKIIQLHGPIEIVEFKKIAVDDRILFIKSLPIDISLPESEATRRALAEMQKYQDYVHAFITDTQTTLNGELRFGATGKMHPWSISKKIVSESRVPVIVAGGLNVENVAGAIIETGAYGVDAHSSLESSDDSLPKAEWKKDLEKVRLFIRNAGAIYRSQEVS